MNITETLVAVDFSRHSEAVPKFPIGLTEMLGGELHPIHAVTPHAARKSTTSGWRII